MAHNPRLVKEADSLTAAGYRVRVVSLQSLDWVARRDQALVRDRAWRNQSVSIVRDGAAGRMRFWRTRLRQHFYQRLFSRVTLADGVAERAFVRAFPELLAVAQSEPANLFIAHTLQALPVAYHAARCHDALLGFDAEDYHTGEFHYDTPRRHIVRLTEIIEERYIRTCAYVSTPSVYVAEALRRRYGLKPPLVIHNVFPWGDRAAMDGQIRDRRGPTLSLHWYSQVISLQRGLADALKAAALLDGSLQIHLRGEVSDAERAAILSLARAYGIAGQVHLHPTVPPDTLLSRVAEHDVGLALEPGLSHSLNNDLTVSNKFFLYALAGLAIAATDTIGQGALLRQAPAAGALYPAGDHRTLARILRRWAEDPEALSAAKAASLEAARTRWNWETEQWRLIDLIHGLLARNRLPPHCPPVKGVW